MNFLKKYSEVFVEIGFIVVIIIVWGYQANKN